MVIAFISLATPAVTMALGRLAGAVLEQLRSPGSGLDDLVEIGSSTVQLATGISRARKGTIGASWLMVFMVLSAQGAVAELPADSGANFLEDLAEGAAAIGISLVGAVLAMAIYDKMHPRLLLGLPRPQPPPSPHPVEVLDPWWKTRTLGRGAVGA